ncbi:unnamed protein product [Didymodactylos carnosus]|uniref:Uncharacterized protein n=1 Tax=Didymodactylos carnosus TaxID=1234261 RepID=A0A814FC05_9BILA|nr:unnamed protein product [Didymodactylos carnosus]CAF0978618.1 unnamed protein product [Didymodactylos carnosus]CAF3599670.1 unnamed protein product [Didymodactylos carnosus]CAF3751372.1 unnamed protein product [Didymodactylos carnosus]
MPYEYLEPNNSAVLNNSNGHKRSSKKSTDDLSTMTATPGEKKKKNNKTLNNNGDLSPRKSTRERSQEIADVSLHENTSDYPLLNTSDNDDKLSTLFNTTGRERNSTGPLKQWLFEHQHHPYPKESDKQMLMEKTKMSLSQITVWFTNARVKMRKENKLPHNAYSKKPKNNGQQQPHNMDKESSFDELDRSLSNDESYPMSNSLMETNHHHQNNVERQLANTQIVLAYTCLNLEQMTELERFSTTFHIHLSDVVDEKTTHLITGDEARPLLCPLTIKVFQAIARHLFIISHRWIVECLTKNQLVDETTFEIRGDVPYSDYHDGMRTSRLMRYNDHGGLFKNYNLLIECDGCQNKMSKNDLIALIKLCNGNVIDCLPSNNTTKTTTVILCEKLTYTNSEQLKYYENCKQANIHFLSPEWILESIVHYSIQPYDEYEEKL